MATSCLVFCLLVFNCFLFHTAFGQCKEGWFYHEGSCYAFGEDTVAWAEAEELCELFGAKLAEIETQEENNYLKNLAKTKVAQAAWVGGTDIMSEGNWVWVSSAQPIYPFTDWAPDEPNQSGGLGGEDCLQLYQPKNYQWNDAKCDTDAFFICEAEPSAIVVG